ncbi:MAG TPA: hypothetical protein VLV29_10585 [Steroidobacteraceae bacterium]|nr:hypothetical protein [Steroidobacteraceae bacterium]
MKQLCRTFWVALLLGVLPLGAPAQTAKAPAGAAADQIPRPEDLEPGVDTTKSAPSVPAAAADTAPGPATPAASGAAAAGKGAVRSAPPKGAAAGKTPAKKGPDRLELEATDVTGNSELPKVLYIVPWKPSELGDMVGRPVNSLLDEVLQPLDRDVFKRENRYYEALKPDAAAAKSDAAQGSEATP